jgi:hypothetical protein
LNEQGRDQDISGRGCFNRFPTHVAGEGIAFLAFIIIRRRVIVKNLPLKI